MRSRRRLVSVSSVSVSSFSALAVSFPLLSDDAYDVAESPANPPPQSSHLPAYHCSKSTRNFSRLRSNRACR